jgi:hypothetical protein
MAVPTLTHISQDQGPTAGDDLVRLTGRDFARRAAVWFADAQAEVVRVGRAQGVSFIDVQTPPHGPALVDVVLWNLDRTGLPIAGERATLLGAYRYVRGPLVDEAALTRVVRKLLQDLKRDVLENSSISVSVDYQPPGEDDSVVVPLASLPSLVISGPTLRENRFYRSYEPRESFVAGRFGLEIAKHRPPFTADLAFTITGASSSTVELLNLMSAVVTFLSRHRWLGLDRDPEDASKGQVCWELHVDGEARSSLHGAEGVRVFTAGLLVRGFDVDAGLPRDRTPRVEATDVEIRDFTAEAAR